MVHPATLTTFEFKNEGGILATIGAAVAVEDVHVHGFTLCAKESTKTAHLVTQEQQPTLARLDEEAISRRSREVLVVRLRDGARSLGEIGGRLADADVNVEATMSLDESGQTELALAVDDLQRAHKVLADEPDQTVTG